MSEGHTPGPWKYRRGWRAGEREWGNWVVQVNASHLWTASKSIVDEKSRAEYAEAVGGTEAEANACLIAAAPDLLEAAKETLRAYEQDDAFSEDGFAALGKAIDKAEGNA